MRLFGLALLASLFGFTHGSLGIRVKECPPLPNPEYSKGYTCTNGRKAGSICWLRCDESKGYAPGRGQFTKCSVYHTWTNLRIECQDIEAPRIQNCPVQTIVKPKDPSSLYTYVKWEKPLTVTDNSGERLAVKAIGAPATTTGGLFEEGTTLVRLTAQDRANNSSPMCAFTVRIKAVTCDPPKMDDRYLETRVCQGLREGQVCSLQCHLALHLVGPRFITCMRGNSSSLQFKGYWSYGQHVTPTAGKPYCRVHSCPELRAPNFGAISCDKWELGTRCTISCRRGYDFPESEGSVPKLYKCQSSRGRWNNDHVPDCFRHESSKQIRMKSYHYFPGSCSASTETIKRNFLTIIDEEKACPFEMFCTTENVSVRCG